MKNCNFINYTRLTFVSDPAIITPVVYEKNSLEKLGDLCLWPMTTPSKKLAHKIVMVALAVLAIHFAFYPAAIKMAFYITAGTAVLGIVARSIGRFCNTDLMRQFHARKPLEYDKL